MSNCSADKIVAALHEQAQIITRVVHETGENSDRLALRLIPDGGTTARDANDDSVIYGEAQQAPVSYKEEDYSPRPLVEGEMTARNLRGNSGIFQTDINDIDDNACHGQVTIDFAQGYRIRRTKDFTIAYTTPIKCARELERLGKSHIMGYFKGMYNQFTRYGMDNFAENLLNLTIQYGEANTSVLAANQFNVTAGGWQAPPEYRLSIFALQEWREHIVATRRGFGLVTPDDYLLEIEAPRDDWFDAVRQDQYFRNGTSNGVVYNTELFKDEEGALRGRQYGVYGGIKCYFNERPIRGYYVQNGTVNGSAVYKFVRIYDWMNVVGEEGGVVRRDNPQYREDSIIDGGVKYDVVTLIPHIDPISFKRMGLLKPIKPYGNANDSVNYQVSVIDGGRLACNDFDDKFKLVARHDFRFKAEYPELSGFMAYRHSRRQGYVIEVTPRVLTPGPDNFAGPQEFRKPAPDNCEAIECAQCDKVTDENGQCVESGEPSVLRLSPAGAVDYAHFGVNGTLRLTVERSGGLGSPASVNYATADGTASAGSDYTAASGTLNWEAEDNTPRYIDVAVLAAAADTETFTVTLSAPSGASIGAGSSVATVTIVDV